MLTWIAIEWTDRTRRNIQSVKGKQDYPYETSKTAKVNSSTLTEGLTSHSQSIKREQDSSIVSINN